MPGAQGSRGACGPDRRSIGEASGLIRGTSGSDLTLGASVSPVVNEDLSPVLVTFAEQCESGWKETRRHGRRPQQQTLVPAGLELEVQGQGVARLVSAERSLPGRPHGASSALLQRRGRRLSPGLIAPQPSPRAPVLQDHQDDRTVGREVRAKANTQGALGGCSPGAGAGAGKL